MIFTKETEAFYFHLTCQETETAVSIPHSVADNAEQGETWINKC